MSSSQNFVNNKRKEMTFNVNLEMLNEIAIITLVGKLDVQAIPQFKIVIDKIIESKAKRIVLMAKELTYIVSIGLRYLILLKQSLGPSVDIFFISPQPFVKEILEMTGFHYELTILNEYDPKLIENI